MSKNQVPKKSINEILLIVKTCLTSFWFWLPALYCIYFYLQIGLIFLVHPYTIFILPFILSLYIILREEKRAKAFYKLHRVKYVSASSPLGEGPKWKVKESIREYEKLLGKKRKKQEESS